MSTSVSGLSTNFFPDAENGFTSTTAGSVASAATTVTLNSVAGYTNGEPAVFVIDPTDTTKKQTFTGIIDTSGVQVTSVVWTAGTNTTHALGATVVDYATATHIAMISKGIKVAHNQDGTHKTSMVMVTPKVDVIGENTAATGVTIDGVLLKDNKVATAGAIENTAISTGMVAQVVGATNTSNGTTTTVLPADDTIPQNTEGVEVATQAITPKSATNILVIEAWQNVVVSTATATTIALFQDSTAGGLAASEMYQSQTSGFVTHFVKYIMTAGTTSATTFKYRVGQDAAGTFAYGSRYGTAHTGGIMITEYKS